MQNIIASSNKWWPRNDLSYNNFLQTVTDLLDRGVYSYDQALQDAKWWPPDHALIDHLVLCGPKNMSTGGLSLALVDASLSGCWPKIIASPIGRLIRLDLWRAFRKEHNLYFHDVISILRHAYDRGILDVNEQNVTADETAFHILVKGAFPQALWMPCVQELIATLIEMGADLSIKDDRNKTVYDYAVEKGAPDKILRLLAPSDQ